MENKYLYMGKPYLQQQQSCNKNHASVLLFTSSLPGHSPSSHHIVLPLFGGVQTNVPTRSNLIKTNEPRSFFHLPPLPGHVVLVLSSCSFLKNNHTAHEIFLFVFVFPENTFDSPKHLVKQMSSKNK